MHTRSKPLKVTINPFSISNPAAAVLHIEQEMWRFWKTAPPILESEQPRICSWRIVYCGVNLKTMPQPL